MTKIGVEVWREFQASAERQQSNAAKIEEDYKTFYKRQASRLRCDSKCTEMCLRDLATADVCVWQNCNCDHPIKITET